MKYGRKYMKIDDNLFYVFANEFAKTVYLISEDRIVTEENVHTMIDQVCTIIASDIPILDIDTDRLYNINSIGINIDFRVAKNMIVTPEEYATITGKPIMLLDDCTNIDLQPNYASGSCDIDRLWSAQSELISELINSSDMHTLMNKLSKRCVDHVLYSILCSSVFMAILFKLRVDMIYPCAELIQQEDVWMMSTYINTISNKFSNASRFIYESKKGDVKCQFRIPVVVNPDLTFYFNPIILHIEKVEPS